jgi:hypothetical protein
LLETVENLLQGGDILEFVSSTIAEDGKKSIHKYTHIIFFTYIIILPIRFFVALILLIVILLVPVILQ